MGNITGPERLKSEVMGKGLCAGCGACVGLCPYIYAAGEKIAMVHSCGLEEGNCHMVCPRLDLNPAGMDIRTFGKHRSDHIIGENRGIYFARAKDPNTSKAGQYGGVVSALAIFLLETKKVEAAVLAGSGSEYTEPVLAKTSGEVLQCAGSKYSACPSLIKLSEGLRSGLKKLAVTGRPCQIAALRKTEQLCVNKSLRCISADNVEFFAIGLFCFWSLTPEFCAAIREKSAGEAVTRYDIPPNQGLIATLEGGSKVEIPLEEARRYIRGACLDCFDPTAEYADLSVGSTEHDTDWNTLIVRSDRGESLIREALDAGAIEIKPYPPEILSNLYNAVRNKKSRVLENLKPTGYLSLSDEYIAGFKETKKHGA